MDNKETARSWWAWHAEKQAVDTAVLEAINEPNGGDYAAAVIAIRKSSRPPAVKQFEVGQLIVGGIMEKAARRPPETLEEGLRLMEDAAVMPGPRSEANFQQLRFLFERGDGTPPVEFPKDQQVADCWHRLENAGRGEPARCVALRRRRIPHVGP